MNRKIYHYLPSFVLGAFAALFFLLFQVTFFISKIALDPELYTMAMTDRDISGAVYADLETYFNRISAATGVPGEVYMKSVDKTDIAHSVNNLITDSINYLSKEDAYPPKLNYDFSQLEKDLTDYFETYAAENNIEKNEEYDKLLKSTISMAETQISGKLDVLFLEQISSKGFAQTIHKYAKLVSICMYSSAAAIIILFGIMLRINRHHLANMLYWLGSVLFAAAGTALIPTVYLKFSGYFDNFFIKTEYIQKALKGIIDSVFGKVLTFEMICVVIGVLLVIGCAVVKRDILSGNHVKKSHR